MRKHSIWKKTVSVALCIALGVGMMANVKLSANAESEPLTGKTALEVASMMDKGWNLGNSFDATGGKSGDIESHETSWGNPVVVRELIHGVKEAGYSTIRIPCTWAKHMDKNNNYAIEPEFIERIKEVIDWCYEEDLFVILNVHHEGWLNKETFDDDYEEIGVRLGALWTQVADYFKDYDQHLIFEGMNEPRAQGTGNEWNPHPAGNDAVNYLNQVFVDAVRTNAEGYNAERILGIPGYCASNSAAGLRAIKMPEVNGEPATNVMISIHCYSPYEFCLTDKQDTFSVNNASDTSDIKRMMSDIKTLFTDNGIAAYIGECGATNSGNNHDARIEWFNYFGKVTREANVPAIVWDNGNGGTSSGECHRYINRKTGELVNPELTQAFITGYDPSAAVENVSFDFEPVKQGDSTVVVTPVDMGFAPKQLMNQSKINHTEGAAVGFALKIAKNIDNHTASYDLSKYAGNTIAVSFYVLSETEGARVGYVVNGTAVDLDVSASSEWSKYDICLNINEGETAEVHFIGNGEDTIYIDDMTIEILDEAKENAILSENSADGEAASLEAGISVTEPSGENETVSEDKKESNSTIIVIIILLVGCLGIAGAVVNKRKKSK